MWLNKPVVGVAVIIAVGEHEVIDEPELHGVASPLKLEGELIVGTRRLGIAGRVVVAEHDVHCIGNEGFAQHDAHVDGRCVESSATDLHAANEAQVVVE